MTRSQACGRALRLPSFCGAPAHRRTSSCAADGYQVVFSLTELDAAFGGRNVVLVDRQDGHPLSQKDGPLRLVVGGDKRPARWIREVETIEVVDGSSGPGHTSAHTETDPGK
jgi:hypothetical protein